MVDLDQIIREEEKKISWLFNISGFGLILVGEGMQFAAKSN